MKTIYFVKDGDKVLHFDSEEAMHSAGFATAETTCTDEEFGATGCYTRIVNGQIVIGRTNAEKAEEAKQAELAQIDAALAAEDAQYGPRPLRDAALLVVNLGDAAREKLVACEARCAALRNQRTALMSPTQNIGG